MSDLIEAIETVAEALRRGPLNDFSYAARLDVAGHALAALRETHHVVPKDQEPVGWRYRVHTPDGVKNALHFHRSTHHDGHPLTDEQALYALEKRHD